MFFHLHKSLLSKVFVCLTLSVFLLSVSSCSEEGQVISKPDEVTHVFQSSERILLKAIAQVMTDKGFGRGVIDYGNNVVESDYTVQDEWRTKAIARVRKISRRETEATLTVITEKKTGTGWELRRLLGSQQYETLFAAIETQIYRELYKVD
jgi:hypothetical protein